MEFLKNTVKAAARKVKSLFTATVRHTEAAAILTLSAVGLNSLAGELPFLYSLPMWIETPLVIPVLSVLAISLLLKSAEIRGHRHMVAA